jgi:hypothetical protein
MAKQSETKRKELKKISRPGVHSKAKTSKLKSSKNYVKKSVGQGK